MDRVGWTHKRNNCSTWSSLDPDLLVIVAKHCDGESVCRLSQACKEWRDAVAANSEQIWKRLVLDDTLCTVEVQFETYYPHSDMDSMNFKEVLSYLEHGINWN